MWIRLYHPKLSDQPTLMHQVGSVTHWRKRNDLPRVKPRTSRETIAKLASALCKAPRQEKGCGRHCTVEHFRRADGTDYFVAYPDDFVQMVMMHDDEGNLTSHLLRPTFETVFAYNRDDGTLELISKVPSSLKPKLEWLFGEIILGQDIGTRKRGRPYDLNHLKDHDFRLDTDPADRLSASLCKLRLDLPKGRITVEAVPNGRKLDIREAMEGHEKVHLKLTNEGLIGWLFWHPGKIRTKSIATWSTA